MKKTGVIGLGTMGAGIAQVLLLHGFSLKIWDVDPDIGRVCYSRLIKQAKKSARKGLVTQEEAERMQQQLSLCQDLADFADREFIIEAVFENIAVKRDMFSKLEQAVSPETILASNTSSISITSIAKDLTHKQRVVGLHFFNPPQYMKLVEVVRGYMTNDETLEASVTLIKQMGKEPIVVKDTPGFIVNRILVPMIAEAIKLVESGVASCADIDQAMVLGANLPQGPLKLADMVGLDVILHVQEIFYQAFGNAACKPSVLLRQMVDSGHLGMKTGKGFYDYQ